MSILLITAFGFIVLLVTVNVLFAGLSGVLEDMLLIVTCVSVASIIGIFAVTGIFGFSWVAADHKATIINREYGTDYTRAEVFYARDVIDVIRQIDRQRVELDGDLFSKEQSLA